MAQFGLIGNKLDHSYSADYFYKKFEKEGLKGFDYGLFPLKNIKELNKLLKENPDIIGLNVTTPYKKDVLPFLYEIDQSAIDVWAVNTIKVNRVKSRTLLKGYNTDSLAFQASVSQLIGENQVDKALVLGTGGAAQAAKVALENLGIETTLVSRQSKFEFLNYKDLNPATILSHKLIVNASPVGMYPEVDDTPNIPFEFIGEKHFAFDMVYNPEETQFLKKAAAQGAQTKNGLEMLYKQADLAWDIWMS